MSSTLPLVGGALPLVGGALPLVAAGSVAEENATPTLPSPDPGWTGATRFDTK
ncbi:MAG TPA: hypothetical protein VGO51_16275 [Burkholderiaceae bacterium]|nr:hypothetical protein [Burkholderiaceae bacterium]